MDLAEQPLEIKVPIPSEIDAAFLQGMVNRMTMSFFKYGPVADAYPAHVKAIPSLQDRLTRYAETGNTEYLMDVANFAMIEFMFPSSPRAFFRPTDSDESPGRQTNRDEANALSNKDLATLARLSK